MYKLIVFDLDGTLAPHGKGMLPENLEKLKALEQKNVRIAICSGKPTYYLCGFMRQIGLEKPILVGENGAVIQFGVALPPQDFYVAPYSDAAKRSLHLLKAAIDEAVPDVWYQPNLTALTPFLFDDQGYKAVQDCIDRLAPELEDVTIYPQDGCYDIVPNGISKQSGLRKLGELLGITPEETVAIGDGINDYPMFEYAGLPLGISLKEAERVHHNFATIGDALDYLTKLL